MIPPTASARGQLDYGRGEQGRLTDPDGVGESNAYKHAIHRDRQPDGLWDAGCHQLGQQSNAEPPLTPRAAPPATDPSITLRFLRK